MHTQLRPTARVGPRKRDGRPAVPPAPSFSALGRRPPAPGHPPTTDGIQARPLPASHSCRLRTTSWCARDQSSRLRRGRGSKGMDGDEQGPRVWRKGNGGKEERAPRSRTQDTGVLWQRRMAHVAKRVQLLHQRLAQSNGFCPKDRACMRQKTHSTSEQRERECVCDGVMV